MKRYSRTLIALATICNERLKNNGTMTKPTFHQICIMWEHQCNKPSRVFIYRQNMPSAYQPMHPGLPDLSGENEITPPPAVYFFRWGWGMQAMTQGSDCRKKSGSFTAIFQTGPHFSTTVGHQEPNFLFHNLFPSMNQGPRFQQPFWIVQFTC